MIHIYLKTIEGKQYSFVIDPRLPLSDLQEVVMNQTGIAKEEMKMICKQQNLMDCEETKSIEECGVDDHTVIHVFKVLKKCSC